MRASLALLMCAVRPPTTTSPETTFSTPMIAFASSVRPAPGTTSVRNLLRHRGPTHHAGDELVAGDRLGLGLIPGVLAIAQDRDRVTQLEHLLELVADEDDRNTLLAQVAQDGEQHLRLEGRQRCRRLLRHQDAPPTRGGSGG